MIDFKKFFFILPISFRNQIFILLIISLIGVFFEILGIGLIFPAISLITNESKTFFNLDFNEIYMMMPFNDKVNFTEFIFIGLFLTFFLKFCFFLFLSWYQASFIEKLSTSLSKKLFKNYVYADYSFYYGKNSEELMRNVISEAGVYIKKVFIPTIQTIMDIFILLGILILLLFIDIFSSSILITVYFIFVIIYLSIIKNKLIRIGSEQLEHDKLKIKSSQEAFLGIKTIKIFSKELEFINRYIFHYKKIAHLSKITSFIQQIPKYAIELLTISSFIILSLILLQRNQQFIDIVPTLALFMAAAFRLIPSINRITTNNQLMKTGIATQNNLYKELQTKESFDQNIKNKDEVLLSEIKILDLSFYYKKNVDILKNINLNISEGNVIGIVGKTGSGKSTFVDLIIGLLKPTSGQILVNGKDISNFPNSWKKIIGYVPQETFMLNQTIKDNITFISDKKIDENHFNNCLKISEVEEFLKDKIDEVIGEKGITLSGGQKQRIGIARALYKKPQIIIFDEATNALDTLTEKSIMKSIYKLKRKKTLIIISHNKSILNECDKIYEISDKKLIEVK